MMLLAVIGVALLLASKKTASNVNQAGDGVGEVRASFLPASDSTVATATPNTPTEMNVRATLPPELKSNVLKTIDNPNHGGAQTFTM